MKKLISIALLIITTNIGNILAQNATNCSIADPFCTGVTYGFPMNTNTDAETGPNYSCLYSQPNPVWYYLKILDPGDITIYMESPTGNDIDFTCWGPFSNPNTPCTAQLTAACTSCPNNTSDPSFYPSGNTVDCSYDPAEFETCHISNAQTGQYYLLCITNFEDEEGTITFTQSNAGATGAGTTDCSIVTPCEITAMTASPSACNSTNNSYSVSGTITFHDAPTTGQLTITDGTTTQTINAPFTSPVNYNLSNFNSDGSSHTVTAVFTDDQTCTYQVTYTAPASCNQCSTDAGADFSVCGLTTNLSAVTQTGDHNTSWSCTTSGVTFTPVSSPNATVTVPTSGTYTFTWAITNTYGVQCSDNVTVAFTETPVASFTASTINCFGQASNIVFTGTATSTANYNWNFGAGSTVNSGSGSGPYSVTWANPGSITITLQIVDNHCPSNTATVTLNQPTAINANVSVTPVTCASGTNGTVNVNVSGGTPQYNYQWSNMTGPPFSAGPYEVTITDSHNCSYTYPFTVTEPNPIVVVPNQTNLNCYQDNSGSATVNVTGGTGTYDYTWTNNVSNSNLASNLASGQYTVTIEDGNGCVVTNSFVLTEPSAVYIQTVSTINPSCSGACNGVIQITGLGGNSSSYGYNWSNASNTSTINSLCAGQYIVTVYDANMCTATGTYDLTEPAAIVTNISDVVNVLCNGQCTGSATVNITNGSAPFSYTWSNNSSNATATNLCAGDYYVTIFDSNGCVANDSVTITEPTILTSQIINIIPAQCFGDCNGSATISPTGGVPPYTYNWSSGTPDQPTNNALCAGTRFVTVTDANGCTSNSVAMIPQPSELVITNIDKTNLTCNGSNDGTIDVGITGGIGTWYFSIPDYTDTIGHFTNLSAGIYTVTVTDSRGCTKVQDITINEPTPVVITAQDYYSICNGEWAYLSANATGGTPDYAYYWNGVPSITNAFGIHPTSTSSYSVSATDSHGCTSNTITINVVVSQPLIVDVTATPNGICPGDSVELSYSTSAGGGPPYMVQLENGTVVTPPIIITPQISGFYVLYITDVCGSTSHDSVYVTVQSLPQVDFSSDTVVGCEPLSVSFHPQVSSPGQSYFWNFGDGSVNEISFDQNPVHTFAHDGLYDITLTITSSHGCVNSYTHQDMIRVNPTPDARFIFNPQIPSIVDPEVIFTNLSTDADMYIWSFGDGDSSNVENPFHWYKNIGTYLAELIAMTNYGCKDTARSYVPVRDEYTFYAPNYISPDYDDLNDVFYVIGNGITAKNFKMYIYDRWGEIIYETDKYDPNDPQKYGWDGRANKNKEVPIGSYTWLVRYMDPSNVQHEKSGAVNVIR